MDNKLFALACFAVISDLIISTITNTSVNPLTPHYAQELVNNGVDFDYILILAGANPDNLKEAAELAFEELWQSLKGEVNNVLNHDELPTAE